MLMGLVAMNAILPLDSARKEEAKGVDREEALMHAGRVRQRPILITTFIYPQMPWTHACCGSDSARPSFAFGYSSNRNDIGAAGAWPCVPRSATVSMVF
jgi:multidrug efflux pump subunit AcrB